MQNKVKETSDKLKDLKKSAEDVSEEFGHPVSQEQYDAIQRGIIETEQELQNLQREAENSRESLVKIGKAGEGLQNIGGKISGAGEALMPVTAAVTGLGAAGALSFAEVDKTMQLANKTMGNTVEEAEAVNDAMKEAAANSVYGMSDAANAVLNFSRAGLDAEQSISALTPAMNLAAGEGGDLDTVSAGLVATLNSFHAEFDEAGKYADVFASACNNSALDINSLSEAMSVAAPIFSAAGYDVKDTALAMGLMGNAGIEASVSANSLKTGISRLAGGNKNVVDALSALGFETGNLAEQEAKLHKAQERLEETSANLTAKQKQYNEVLEKNGEGSAKTAEAYAKLIKAENDYGNAQTTVDALTEEAANGTSAYGELMVDEYGKMRPFEEVLKDLQGAFSGLSEQEQISAATALFGVNQMTPWLALLNTSEEDVNDLSTALHNSAGTTQEMADTMMSGFGGGIEKLKSSIDVLIYSIGESLAPILQKAIDFIQVLVDKFNALSPHAKETITKVALIVAAIAPLLIVIGKLTTGIGGIMKIFSKMPAIITKVKGAFTAVKTAIMGISAPVVAIAAVIAVLIAAFKHLWETNEDFRNNMIAIWDGIKATFERLTSGITERLNSLGFDFKSFTDILKYVWDWFCNYLAPIFENTFKFIGDILSDAVDVILEIMDFWIGLFTGDWEQCWNGIKEVFIGIWDAIVSTVGTAFELILNIFDTNLEEFLPYWTSGWNTIKDFFFNLWTAVCEFWSGLWEQIQITMYGFFDNTIAGWNSIGDFFVNIFTSIRDFFVNTWNEFQDNFQIGMDAICTGFTNGWTAIQNFFIGIFTTIKDFFVNTWNDIKDIVSNTMTTTKTNVTNIWNNIKSAISSTISGIKDTIVYGFNNAVNFVKNLASEAGNWGSDIIKGIVDGIKSKIGDITDAVTGVADKIRSFLHFSVPDEGPLTDFESWMPDFMHGLADGITTHAEVVENTISGFATNITTIIKSTIETALNSILNTVETFMTQVFTHIQTIWNDSKDTINTVLNAISKGVTFGWNTIVSTIKKSLDAIKNNVSADFNAVKSTISTITNSVQSFTSKSWNKMSGDVKTVLNSIKSNVSSVWNSMSDSVRNAMNAIQNTVLNVWYNVHNGVWDRIWKIRDTIADGLHSSADCIRNLVNQAWHWGYDLMQNLINGINYQMGSLGNIVSDVANMIWEYLHFSVPEKGPLTDFESWMSDFMQGLAKGIQSSQKAVEKAISGVAGAMQLTLDSGLNFDLNGITGAFTGNSGTVNNYYSTDNSRTVNQTNNSPKSLSRLEIYRQTRNALGV
ncbi:MAG: phage tail tape measure protein [Ruminococcus sp.]|nr:phage tail tape measure protein [Ruminococcus sp.]